MSIQPQRPDRLSAGRRLGAGMTLGLVAVLGPAFACGVAGEPTDAEKRAEIERMYTEAERDFPEVPDIGAADLMVRLDEARNEPPATGVVVVDVRPAAEREVSMIPGAIPIEEVERSPELYRESTLVTYCTVGYRSGIAARDLQERGFDVLNLRGSLLAWTHAGGELVDAEGPTNRLHVYGRRWDLAPAGYETTW